MRRGVSRRSFLGVAAGLLGAAAIDAPLAQSTSRRPAPGMLRLIANENPYGPAPDARLAAEKAVAEGWKYAVREVGALKKLVAAHEDVPKSHVMITAGSSEALRVAALAFGRDGGRVIAAAPTFPFLPNYAAALGCDIDEIPLNESMAHDLEAMAAALRADTRLVYVCNPNNPTGSLVAGPQLAEFIDAVAGQAPVVVDEAYLDLGGAAFVAKHSAVASVREGKPVIVTRTFSKLHGMAGLRVGYAIAPPEIIKQLEQLRVTQMSLPGVMAAAASIQDEDFIEFSRARIREGLEITTDVLEELGRPYVPTYGNFVYFDVGRPAREFMGAMSRAGILTGLSYAPYRHWARVSMGRVEEMRVFADAARDYFRADHA